MRMLRLLSVPLFFFSIVHAQTSMIGGGTARNIALGGGPVNPYLQDLLRIHINPSLLVQYPNRVWGDVGFLASDVPQGGSRGQYIATSIGVDGRNFLGLALNRRESPLYNVDAANPPRDPVQEMNTMVASVLGFGAQQFSRPLSPIEAFWASRIDSLNVGASVSYGRWSGERSINGTSQQSVSTIRAKAGITDRISPNTLFDGAVLVGFNSMSGTATPSGSPQNELDMTGGTEFGADLRLKCDFNSNWSFVPIARGYWFSWGMKQVRSGALVIPDPADEYSQSEVELGVGTNFSKNGFLLAGGFSFQRAVLVSDYHTISKTTVTITDLPKINLGAEFVIASWIVGRFGYFDRLSSVETEVASGSATTTTTTSSELPWYGDLNGFSAAQQRITIGVGMSVAGFSLDGTIGEGYFLNGPWPLSGTAQSLFNVVSFSYQF
ncbi:MAG: hypothetical protein KGJ59_04450 [Bacteroidota bacterium]|nr:hypothetical protein [Bacteroidota bacterium]